MSTKRKQDQKQLAVAIALAHLGVIDDRELDRRWIAAVGITPGGGVYIDDGSIDDDPGSIEDAPNERLIDLFGAQDATEGIKEYIASLMVGRGLTACGCEHCQKVEAYAQRWREFTNQQEEDV